MFPLPDYVEYGSKQFFAPIYSHHNSQVFVFSLEADRQVLQALCDKCLNNLVSGFEYRSLDYVIVIFHNVERIDCGESDYALKLDGEVLFLIPVVKIEKNFFQFAWGSFQRFFLSPSEMACVFVPYIFLDSSPGMASGRELYGYPKEMGHIKFPPDKMNASNGRLKYGDCFDLNIRACEKENGEVQQEETLLRITCIEEGGESNLDEKGLSQVQDITQQMSEWLDGEIQRMFPRISNLFNLRLFHNLLSPTLHTVLLKQFRDVKRGSKACYRAIIEAEYTEADFKNFELYFSHPPQVEIDIKPLESHPIAKELGLKPISPEQPDKFRGSYWLWAKLNFKLDEGEIIYESGVMPRRF
ncbi:MAG: acetoacetate decarboxylase family protein [Cyanobacteria bacterium P01_G01_bin.54]